LQKDSQVFFKISEGMSKARYKEHWGNVKTKKFFKTERGLQKGERWQ